MGIERQLKKVITPGLSALALSACLTFLKPVLNLQNSRPIEFKGENYISLGWTFALARSPML